MNSGKCGQCQYFIVANAMGGKAYGCARSRCIYKPTTKNNLVDEEHRGEEMDFPNTFEEFANRYGFKDKEEVYTNGSELIPVFRVKQWLEHISTTKNDLAVSSELEKNSKKLENPTTKNGLGVDCISRAEMLKYQEYLHGKMSNEENHKLWKFIKDLPSVTPQLSVPEVTALAEWTEKLTKECEEAYNKGYADGKKALEQEPTSYPWCTDCKEYDQEKHCCHRWSKAIRNTVEEMKQEYIERDVLDKIRAEIIELRSRQNIGVLECLDIIDKYRYLGRQGLKEGEVEDDNT